MNKIKQNLDLVTKREKSKDSTQSKTRILAKQLRGLAIRKKLDKETRVCDIKYGMVCFYEVCLISQFYILHQ